MSTVASQNSQIIFFGFFEVGMTMLSASVTQTVKISNRFIWRWIQTRGLQSFVFQGWKQPHSGHSGRNCAGKFHIAGGNGAGGGGHASICFRQTKFFNNGIHFNRHSALIKNLILKLQNSVKIWSMNIWVNILSGIHNEKIALVSDPSDPIFSSSDKSDDLSV